MSVPTTRIGGPSERPGPAVTTAGPAPELVERVRELLAARHVAVPGEADLRAAVQACGLILDQWAMARLLGALRGELAGLGPLEPLLADPLVTDVLVNGPEAVWVDRGSGLVRAPVVFPDEPAVRRLAVRLAALASRRLDDASPWVDARLPGGQRLHAVIPPLSVSGTLISLRVPSRRRFTLADLEASRSVDATAARWLRAIVAARATFLVTGGTGSGKTSVLGALLGLVPPRERIVVVEDTCELAPEHPHVVSLEARAPNVEGAGEIPLRALVRQALRMRPDRLVVGEVRGPEVVDMLAGFNTGHEGACGTLHANSAAAVPDRVAALALAAGMSLEGVGAQLGAGLEAVVHLSRLPDGRRVVAEIGVVCPEGAGPVVRPALLHQHGAWVQGAGAARLAERLGVPVRVPDGQVP
jgi:pilus assembly protein CpaF